MTKLSNRNTLDFTISKLTEVLDGFVTYPSFLRYANIVEKSEVVREYLTSKLV